MRLFETKAYAILVFVGNQRAKAAYPPLSEGHPPDERKEGDTNGYICGLVPVLYIHCCPCGIVLYNLQGKKIAATIRSSDGCY